MEQRDEGMGLATTERGLQLNDSIAFAAFHAAFHTTKQLLQPLGHVGFFKKPLGVSIFSGSLAFRYVTEICGVGIQGEIASLNIAMRLGNVLKFCHGFILLLDFHGLASLGQSPLQSRRARAE